MVVIRLRFSHPSTVRTLKDITESIGGQLVRRHDAKIAIGCVADHHVAEETPQYPRRFSNHSAGLGDLNGVVAKIR